MWAGPRPCERHPKRWGDTHDVKRLLNHKDAKGTKTTKGPEEEIERLAHGVIGAAIEVHKVLGPGFLETVYEEALCIELEQRNISFKRQFEMKIPYKGRQIGTSRLDLVVGNRLIIELKAVDNLGAIHMAQVLSYLKATRLFLALLINFNVRVLREGIKRVVRS